MYLPDFPYVLKQSKPQGKPSGIQASSNDAASSIAYGRNSRQAHIFNNWSEDEDGDKLQEWDGMDWLSTDHLNSTGSGRARQVRVKP